MSTTGETSSSQRQPIPILSYHQTCKPPRRGTPMRTLTVSPGAFARQLRALKLIGYQGLAMRDLEPYLRGEKTGKVVGITLDDGYVSNFEHALPALREVGFTATAFIVSGQFGGSNIWDHPMGIPPARLMDVAHLKTWMAAGMEIGAHTRNHVKLTECDDATAREEIAGCKQDLELALGVPIRHFAYPYGLHRVEHADMVREAGYAGAVTVEFARVRWDDPLYQLPRVSVYRETSVPLLLAQAATSWVDRRRPRPLRQPVPAQAAPEPRVGMGQGATT